MRHTYLCLSVLLLLLSGLTSCRSEDEHLENPIVDPPTYGVYISVVPTHNANTRANAYYVAKDDSVRTLHAIYFQKGKYTGAQQVEQYRNYPEEIDCRIENYPKGDSVQIMFVANAEATVREAKKNNGFSGLTPDQVRAKLILKLGDANKHIWAVNKPKPTSNPKDTIIPMYAITGNNVILPTEPIETNVFVRDNDTVTTDKQKATVYDLVRTVAKIRIINKETPLAGRKKFELKNVYSVNAKDSGMIAYAHINWSPYWKRVSSPTLYNYKAPVGKKNSNEQIANIPGFTSSEQVVEFYLFEAGLKVDDVASDENCYIKLTGKVGEGLDQTDGNFMLPIPYVQLKDGKIIANQAKPGPLLRNHLYEYTIEGVTNNRIIDAKIRVVNWTEREFSVDL